MSDELSLRISVGNGTVLADHGSKVRVLVEVAARGGQVPAELVGDCRMVLVVDRSPVMTDVARSVVATAATSLAGVGGLSIVAFGADVNTRESAVRGGSDHPETAAEWLSWFDRLPASDGRNVLGALRAAALAVDMASERRRRVVVLTDGEADVPELHDDGADGNDAIVDVARRLRAAGASLSTVGVGTGYDDLLLSDLAAIGGGRHRYLPSSSEAAVAMGQEIADLTATVAGNVQVTLTTVADATVSQINLRYRSQRSERSLLHVLDDGVDGRSQPLLFEMQLPPRPPGDYRIASVALTWQNASTGEKRESHGQIMVTCGTDEQAIREGISQPVLRRFEEVNALQELKTVVELVRVKVLDVDAAVTQVRAKGMVLERRAAHGLARAFTEVADALDTMGTVDEVLVKTALVACMDAQQGGDGRALASS